MLTEKIEHFGNPVLRWMLASTVVKTDPAGNIKPDKEKSVQKIDGIVAGIMAELGAIPALSPAARKLLSAEGFLSYFLELRQLFPTYEQAYKNSKPSTSASPESGCTPNSTPSGVWSDAGGENYRKVRGMAFKARTMNFLGFSLIYGW